jgi:hypothetical protein
VAKPRNYAKEYSSYQGTPEQIKRRASRNAARAEMVKAGKAHKGDGLDVGHKTGNPMINGLKNLKMQTKHDNRSYPRTKTAGKKNPRD